MSQTRQNKLHRDDLLSLLVSNQYPRDVKTVRWMTNSVALLREILAPLELGYRFNLRPMQPMLRDKHDRPIRIRNISGQGIRMVIKPEGPQSSWLYTLLVPSEYDVYEVHDRLVSAINAKYGATEAQPDTAEPGVYESESDREFASPPAIVGPVAQEQSPTQEATLPEPVKTPEPNAADPAKSLSDLAAMLENVKKVITVHEERTKQISDLHVARADLDRELERLTLELTRTKEERARIDERMLLLEIEQDSPEVQQALKLADFLTSFRKP